MVAMGWQAGRLSGVWRRMRIYDCALACVLLLCLSPVLIAQPHWAGNSFASSAVVSLDVASPDKDPLVDSAFDHFYNMEYDRSVQEFERILDRRPDDPFAINHLLTAV